jgi:hypothetical protein
MTPPDVSKKVCNVSIEMGTLQSTDNNPQAIHKKALLMGLNYSGQSGQLNGCINDTDNLANMLINKKYFTKDEMTIMNDNESGNLYPGHSQIYYQLNELVKFANSFPGEDVLLFWSYSGHGSYQPDEDGDEEDNQDELLCPLDYETNGFISDDDIKKTIINMLPQNAKLFILIDACHTGTCIDLRYNYLMDGKTISSNNSNSLPECNVVMISGCRDDQTSSDAYIQNEYQGAMTAAFIDCFYDGIIYKRLLKNMRSWLSFKGFDQVPQLSSGKYINLNSIALLSEYDDHP